MEIILLIAGLIIGFVIGYLIVRSRITAEFTELSTQNGVSEQRVKDMIDQKLQMYKVCNDQREEIRLLTAEFSAAKNELENSKKTQ